MPEGKQRRPAPNEEPHGGQDASGDTELLTLQEAADRLKVHYMTAYRWVRRGDLPAFKAGGRLRIRSADLEGFVAERAVDTAMPRPGQRTDWPTHVERLHRHLRDGDGVEATSMVRKIIADGAPVGDVYLRLITPAMRRIGDDWARDEICVAEEHRATEIASAIIKRHGEAFRRRGPRKGTAVACSAPGDLHSLGAAMVADFLRGGGYDVSYLGADVPTEELDVFLRAEPADVVCLSVTTPGLLSQVYADTVEAARRARPRAVVIFGGQSADPAAIEASGGRHRDDLLSLSQYLTDLVGV